MAEEAAVTAEVMGNTVDRLYDVGVAGLHRLLKEHARLIAARVIVVVAGHGGRAPSVIGGLVDVPVVAVPTSVGYGASFGGLTALLAMLNSCATGISVVNIDNGFGAAAIASFHQPLRLIWKSGLGAKSEGCRFPNPDVQVPRFPNSIYLWIALAGKLAF